MEAETLSRLMNSESKTEYDYDGLNRRIWPDPIPERAKEYLLHPGMFTMQAAFDKVLIAQIMNVDLEQHRDDHGNVFWTLRGQTMALPDKAVHAAMQGAPRGIVISAGLRALDELRTNGIQLGDIVRFVRLTPYRMPIGLDPKTFNTSHFVVCEANAIVSSEDLLTRMQAGQVESAWHASEDFSGHVYVGQGIPGAPKTTIGNKEGEEM